MTEIKVTINAPELSEALGALARVLDKNSPATSTPTTSEDQNTFPQIGSQPATVKTDAVAAPNPTVAPSAAPVQPTVVTTTSVPMPAPNTAPTPTVVPTSAPTYTLDAIARAGTALLDAGKMNELTELLKKYGADTLVTINPTYYGAVAADLRALGAQI